LLWKLSKAVQAIRHREVARAQGHRDAQTGETNEAEAKGADAKLPETSGFSRQRLQQARTVLQHSRELAGKPSEKQVRLLESLARQGKIPAQDYTGSTRRLERK
jgi:hypothetical protein